MSKTQFSKNIIVFLLVLGGLFSRIKIDFGMVWGWFGGDCVMIWHDFEMILG